VYVGSYSGVIHQYELTLSTGKLTARSEYSGLRRPSALAIHPNHRSLYSVDDTSKSGAVRAFSIDAEAGSLTLLNTKGSGGSGPTHLSVDKTGRFLLVANYNSGSVASLKIEDDGSLGEVVSFVEQSGKSASSKRQSSPHAHQILTALDNRFVLVPDLGTDKLLVYQFDGGALIESSSISSKPGSGPRHVALHPGGRFVYLLTELKSTIMTLSYQEREGALVEIDTIAALPSSRVGCCAAEIAVHPSGLFLYSSHRGDDSVAMFSIEPSTGALTLLGHQKSGGRSPRNFSIDPTGKYLLVANQSSGSLVVFMIDSQTGLLTMSKDAPLEIPGAAGVEFAPVP
jgi:6-phosphogluconolactonase